MTIELRSPPPVRRNRRPGRRSIDTDLLRTRRLDLDLNEAELAQCQASADAAAMPLRRWARCTLLGLPITVARSDELRRLWSESSTLQSNFNQAAQRLNELHIAGELSIATGDQALQALAKIVPGLYALVRALRVELAAMRGAE